MCVKHQSLAAHPALFQPQSSVIKAGHFFFFPWTQQFCVRDFLSITWREKHHNHEIFYFFWEESLKLNIKQLKKYIYIYPRGIWGCINIIWDIWLTEKVLNVQSNSLFRFTHTHWNITGRLSKPPHYGHSELTFECHNRLEKNTIILHVLILFSSAYRVHFKPEKYRSIHHLLPSTNAVR